MCICGSNLKTCKCEKIIGAYPAGYSIRSSNILICPDGHQFAHNIAYHSCPLCHIVKFMRDKYHKDIEIYPYDKYPSVYRSDDWTRICCNDCKTDYFMRLSYLQNAKFAVRNCGEHYKIARIPDKNGWDFFDKRDTLPLQIRRIIELLYNKYPDLYISDLIKQPHAATKIGDHRFLYYHEGARGFAEAYDEVQTIFKYKTTVVKIPASAMTKQEIAEFIFKHKFSENAQKLFKEYACDQRNLFSVKYGEITIPSKKTKEPLPNFGQFIAAEKLIADN